MMIEPLLDIKDLHASVQGKEILRGVSLTIYPGQIHALMGPNGAGKSTLSKVLAGHPSYEVTSGTVTFLGQDMLSLPPEERARRGLFLSFQQPVELPGVPMTSFLKASFNAVRKARGLPTISEKEFLAILEEKSELLHFRTENVQRHVNAGFSGGEMKKNEMVQMALLDPVVAILDETDSGLDIDSLRVVGNGILSLMTNEKGLLLITHYRRLLDVIQPTVVHVMAEGKIMMSGGPELALKLESDGYDWIVKGQVHGA
jgi:Fe-S cluster assembly ATP-binding protein